MDAQQDRLGITLGKLGFGKAGKPPTPKLSAMGREAQEQVMDLYRALGGILTNPPLATGAWDSAYAGNLVVELDESAHFNRYRAITLEPGWAQQLPWKAAYIAYAAEFEEACRKGRSHGRYWTYDSAERQFGPPGPNGQLDGAGSPRWKQRALYDAMRDITAMHGVVRLVRLSVYDDLGGVPLGSVLSGKTPLNTDVLRALIAERTLG